MPNRRRINNGNKNKWQEQQQKRKGGYGRKKMTGASSKNRKTKCVLLVFALVLDFAQGKMDK